MSAATGLFYCMGQREVVLIRWAELGAGGSSAVNEQLDSLSAEGNRVVLNVAGADDTNALALVHMIHIHRRLRALGGDLVFSEPSKLFRLTISTLGMDHYPSDEEALRHFGLDDGDDFDGVGARLEPRRPSDSGEALPDEEPPDLDA